MHTGGVLGNNINYDVVCVCVRACVFSLGTLTSEFNLLPTRAKQHRASSNLKCSDKISKAIIYFVHL